MRLYIPTWHRRTSKQRAGYAFLLAARQFGDYLMNEHTRGTWHWDSYLDSDYDPPNCGSIYAELVSGQAVAIAKRPRYTNDRQWQADACLMAAAPDLLDIVRKIVIISADIDSCINEELANMAKEALAKAEGFTREKVG
jgi:hypothetical protein